MGIFFFFFLITNQTTKASGVQIGTGSRGLRCTATRIINTCSSYRSYFFSSLITAVFLQEPDNVRCTFLVQRFIAADSVVQAEGAESVAFPHGVHCKTSCAVLPAYIRYVYLYVVHDYIFVLYGHKTQIKTSSRPYVHFKSGIFFYIFIFFELDREDTRGELACSVAELLRRSLGHKTLQSNLIRCLNYHALPSILGRY